MIPSSKPPSESVARSLENLSLLENVFEKLYSLLPIESEKTLIEVEECQLFLSVRKSLVAMSSSELMSGIVHHVTGLLERINQHDNYLVLRQREVSSLASMLIILRLLADLMKSNWDSKDTPARKSSVGSSHSAQSSSSSGTAVGLGSAAIDYHSVPPDKIDSQVALRAILLISRLKSTNTLAQELSMINGKPLPLPPLCEDVAVRTHLDAIDLNCEAILRYLGAANVRDFYEFTVSKLSVLKHNIGNDSEFAPYLELFASVYLDEQWFYLYLKHIRHIMTTVRKPAYRQLVLSFFTKSLKIWIYSRPQEFLNSSKEDSKASTEAETLFDEMLSLPDSTLTKTGQNQSAGKQFRSHFKFIGTLMALNPRALQGYLEGSSTSKNSTLKKFTNFGTNKKQKFLTNVMKVLEQSQLKDSSDNVSMLESLDFVVAIAQVASSIYAYDPNNVAVQYTLETYHIVSRVLVPINITKSSPTLFNPSTVESAFLNHTRMDYYTSMCIMNSKTFIPILVDILNDQSCQLDTLNITCSILRQFSVNPVWLGAHQSQLSAMLPSLRKVMIRMGALVKSNSFNASTLNDDDETASLDKVSSASSTDNYQYRSLIAPEAKTPIPGDLSRLGSNSSSALSTPTAKADKFRESAKNLLKHHHSANHVSSMHANSYSSDDTKSLTDKDTNALSVPRQILLNGFDIFKKNPHSYFFASGEVCSQVELITLVENASLFLDPLVIALRDSNNKLSFAAKQFVQSFVSVTTISDNHEAVASSYTGAALIGNVIARSILNLSSSVNTRKHIMEHFVRILEYRTSLYSLLVHHSSFKDIIKWEYDIYTELMSPIDQALLFILCIPSVETYGLTKKGYKAFYQELDKSKSPEVIRSNFAFYASVMNDSTFTTGTVALQKVTRKFFLKLTDPTPSLIAAWLKIYDKWRQFALVDYNELTQTELANFRNFAAFIAAISGIFCDEEIACQAWYTPEIRSDIRDKIDTFIDHQFSLLREDGLVTRENAREILAVECNPKTYPRMVRLLTPVVETLYTNSSTLAERDLTIIDHIIALIKAVLNKGSDLVIFGCSIDILQAVDQLSAIVDAMKTSDTILKLKIRLSMLFAEVEKSRSELITGSAYKIRNKFLRYVYNWFDDSVSSMSKFHKQTLAATVSKDWDYMYLDIAIESSNALSLALEDLVLEAQQVLNIRELQYSKSSLFSIYFRTFLKALERFSVTEDFPVSMRHKVKTTSDNIVVCLTNLLKSNVDVGLQYALPIGYYNNLAIRVSFLKVFISIVNSYSKLGQNETPQCKARMVSNIFKLMLKHPKFMNALGNAAPAFEAPAFASCALCLSNSMNQSANLISYLVEQEIMAATSYSDILRRNSFASRSLAAFGRTVGLETLVTTLRPILTEIRDSETDIEVEKLSLEDPDGQQNLKNFMHYLTKLVNVIINSFDNIPLEFKFVCKKISEAVDEKFANSRLIAVGSFIFLRYFCPAIVSPATEKIVIVPDRQTQRKYLLLTKVLQNMANGTITSLKWPLLRTREAELLELNSKLNDFLDRLTHVDDDVSFEFKVPSDMKQGDYNFLHTFMYENWSLIRKEFLETVSDASDLEYFRTIAGQIDQFLRSAGQPTMMFGYELPPSITPETNPDLYDFMNKYATKELGDLLDYSFIYQSYSQDGTPLLVFSYSEYERVKDFDEELILYRMIQLASKVWDHKFLFVIDCTGNNGTTLFPRRSMLIFGDFAPDVMRNNCESVIFYNVSSGLYPRLMETVKKNQSFQNVPSDKFKFISGNSDRQAIMNLSLSNQAMHAYSDVRVNFSDVSLFQNDQGRFIPVSMRIGNEFLQISQTTPQRAMLRGSLKEISLNDVYHLDKIQSVAISEKTSVPNEITITFTDGQELVISSSKYLEIMRLLYFTKNRAYTSNQKSDLNQELQKNPEDLLGQLFNVIFLGLTSTSDEVRSISYNLLAVSQKHFHLEFNREIVQFPEVYFPKDNNPFVFELSSMLAKSLPSMTDEFISAFFDVYNDSVTVRQRHAALLYVSPWVYNISEHVYKADAENGRDITSKMISGFLNLASKDPLFLSTLNSLVFQKICFDDKLSGLLVDEVVLNAIDRVAEGAEWKSLLSCLTCFPTIAICGHVVNRLKGLSTIPFPNAKGNYTLESQSTWTQATVLVHIAVSLFFDSLLFTEMFLPDIFHIITLLIDVGPRDLRIGCHQLLLNVLLNFLSKKSIPQSSKDVIASNVSHFTSHRSRLLFGLNRESPDSFPTEISKFNARISSLESLVASLLEVIEVAGDREDKAVWLSRWNRYAVDSICRQDSVLRGRALILIGILAKEGIEDIIVKSIIKYIHGICSEDLSDPKSVYLLICAVFSLKKISEGLLVESELFGNMFWLSVFISYTNFCPLFQSGLKFMIKTLECMSIKEKFPGGETIGTIMATKSEFSDELLFSESRCNVYITAENFDQVLLYFIIKGLQLSYAKAPAIDSLCSLFQFRFMNEAIKGEVQGHMDMAPLCYMLMLSILMNPKDFRQILDDTDLCDDFYVLNDQMQLPKLLADFLLSDSDISNLTLIQAANYFSQGNPNEKTCLRFMTILKFIGHRNPALLMKVYHMVKMKIRAMISSSTIDSDLLSEALDVAAIAVTMPEYEDDSSMRTRTEEFLHTFKLKGILNFNFLAPDDISNATLAELRKYPSMSIMKGMLCKISKVT